MKLKELASTYGIGLTPLIILIFPIYPKYYLNGYPFDNIYEVLGTESWSDVVDAIENNTVSEEASSSAMLECMSTLTEDELAEFLAG